MDAAVIDWQSLGNVTDVRDMNGQDDDSFASGSKEDAPNTWTVTTTPVDNKDDILDTYQSFHRGSDGDAFLYLGMTRATDNGTTFWTFELNQTEPKVRNMQGFWIPCRETGDLLITIDQNGNQGAEMSVDQWVTDTVDPDTGCAATGTEEPVSGLEDMENVEGAFNQEPITDPPLSWDFMNATNGTEHQIPPLQFAEAAIDLTKVTELVEQTQQISCPDEPVFQSIWAHSRASDSADAELKDYVAPMPLEVRLCQEDPSLTSDTAHRAQLGPSTSIQDTATLTGGDPDATGTVTFKLYGPKHRKCSGDPIFQSTRDLSPGASGEFTSDPFTPNRAGTYRWTVEYSGDANDDPAGPTRCGRLAETVAVTKAKPSITTVASAATELPGRIHDSATLLGGVRPRGTIKFELFGPDDKRCTGKPVHTSTVPVRGNHNYNSPQFTPTAAGTWRWVATYSGDANNQSAATACNDLGESVLVSPMPPPPAPPPATPALTTSASAGRVATRITDTAHLTGGSNPTGTITFFVYGPDDPRCTTPAAPPSTIPVSGASDYESPPFTPTEAGTYRWVVSYSGDAANAAAATSCGDGGETVVVSRAEPTITVTPGQPSVRQGQTVHATADLTGGAHPRETITFRLYGPSPTPRPGTSPGAVTCTGTPVFVGRQKVSGNGTYRSPLHAPALPGTYRWKATYSGDRNHASASTACSRPVTVHPRRAVQRRKEHKPKPRKPKPPVPRVTG